MTVGACTDAVRRRALRLRLARPDARLLARSGAHLAVLTSFALAQPLLDLLGRNPEFFTARDSSTMEIVFLAVGLVLVPPAALMLLELLAAVLSERLRAAVHLALVGVLTAMIALRTGKLLAGGIASALLVIAALAGIAAALAYARSPSFRRVLTFLIPVPLVFAGLFLFASPVSKLILVPEAQAAAGEPAKIAKTPVVLVVFDELSTVALMDRRQGIDAGRYPSFAKLAANGTWYRNATTIDDHTHFAVPAILTGIVPPLDRHPIYSDYPNNLFTLLAKTHEPRVVEALTRLCPASYCERTAPRLAERRQQAGVLASDVGVVYLHALLPERFTGGLPSISETWGGFAAGGEEEDRRVGEQDERSDQQQGACSRYVCEFLKLLSPTARPGLYFLHSMLPHAPWRFLPSGQFYEGNVRDIPGKGAANWGSDEWLISQAYQRYLLQVGYTDLMLGRILDRLEAEGLYDRSLIIVTADHGTSFRARAPRRNIARSNFDEIAFVPLLVKLPGQQAGRVSNVFVRNVDILPTIAAVLNARIPWRTDGRSLTVSGRSSNGTVTILDQGGRAISESLSSLVRRRNAALAHQVALFQNGNFDDVYAVGPNRQLLGKALSTLATSRGRNRVRIDGNPLGQPVDPDARALPVYLTGTVTGTGARRELALALNGTIAAVTRTYADGGQTRFAALLPPAKLRPGVNELSVYVVRKAASGLSLEELRRD
jgi:hypothetical protein